MATTYQLWDTETRNLVAEFETREEALAAVKRTLEADGRALAETLFLGVDEEGGAGGVIAQGAALVALALGAARDPGSTGATGSTDAVGGEAVGGRAVDPGEADRGAVAGAMGYERDEGDFAAPGRSRRR